MTSRINARDSLIESLSAKGWAAPEIARKLHLNRRHVALVIKKHNAMSYYNMDEVESLDAMHVEACLKGGGFRAFNLPATYRVTA